MNERATQDLYAAGLDSTQLRCLQRESSLQSWCVGSCDVHTAFLLAPTSQSELIVIQPPRILVECGVVEPGTMWIVTGALYGLTTAPRDWSQYRDSRLLRLTWDFVMGEVKYVMSLKQLEDPNVWQVIGTDQAGVSTVMGYLAVYVDDILFMGSQDIVEPTFQCVRNMWTVSDLEMVGSQSSMKFCGQWSADGSTLRVHQESYLSELLIRHEVKDSAPYVPTPDDPVTVDSPCASVVRRAQAIAGELLWLSGRTRPDIAMAVSRVSQWVTRAPVWAFDLGMKILKYLKSCPELGLNYGPLQQDEPDEDWERPSLRTEKTVEVLTDSSFAPMGGYSVSGLVILFAGAPVQWHTQRQTIVALSTAEAELVAMVDALQAGRSVRSFIELISPGTVMEMFGDNRAAIILASGRGGGWRTRHLRIRSAALADAISRGELMVFHQPGTRLLADALTKLLPVSPLLKFKVGMGMVPFGQKCVSVKSIGVSENKGVSVAKRCLSLILASALCVPACGSDFERDAGSNDPSSDSSMDWLWVVMLAALIVWWECLRHWGVKHLRRLVFGDEDKMKVKLLHDEAVMPTRGTDGSAGFDISLVDEVILRPGERYLANTGVAVELPRGTYGRLASRSGLSSRFGIEVGAGVIDADFRGEVKVLLFNHGSLAASFKPGDRIAQLVVEQLAPVNVVEVKDLSTTARSSWGFGSTGTSSMTERGSGNLRLRAARMSNRDDPTGGIRAWLMEDESAAMLRVPSSSGINNVNNPSASSGFVRDPGLDHLGYLDSGDRNGRSMSEMLLNQTEKFQEDMCPVKLFRNVAQPPADGTNNYFFNLTLDDGRYVTVHTHGEYRRRLFDVRLGTGDVDEWHGVSMTLAWFRTGMSRIIISSRKGSSSPYLNADWKGFTVLYKKPVPMS